MQPPASVMDPPCQTLDSRVRHRQYVFMERDEFITLAERQLADLGREDAALAAQEDGVRRKREVIQERIDALAQSVKVYRLIMGIGIEPTPPARGMFDDIPMGSVSDMAFALIRRNEAPMKVSDIAKALQQAGKLKANADTRSNYSNVYGVLRRDRRFTRPAQGTFGVAGTNETSSST